jgi:hypothetical protein
MDPVIVYSRADPLMDRGGPDRASRGDPVPPRCFPVNGHGICEAVWKLVAFNKTSNRPDSWMNLSQPEDLGRRSRKLIFSFLGLCFLGNTFRKSRLLTVPGPLPGRDRMLEVWR